MGKTTGFMEFERIESPKREPAERVNDWQEFKQHLPEKELCQQGARCMECGIPYCHPGIELGTGVSGCPLNNLIPEWNDLIYRGQDREALERLLKTNSFPEFTGRVCPAPCEGSCTVGMNKVPVSIKAIEKHIIDQAFEKGWIKPRLPKKRTGKTVAVIGSGPAGLAAAEKINQAGHRVTIYEKADRPGGLLMYGIPNMKLDKQQVLYRRIKLMKQEGITFLTGIEVGEDISPERLQQSYEAVVLCCGAEKPRDLSVPGRELDGIHFAVDYLTASTKKLLANNNFNRGRRDNLAGISEKEKELSARGKDVLVIGGGDTGTDCVATALRQGCESITQFEILPCPPEERRADNPWPEWPQTLNVDYGQQEAIAIFGDDPREFRIMTKKFTGDGRGNVQQAHTVKVRWEKDEKGQNIPREISGTEEVYDVNMVILALGFLGPEDSIIEAMNLKQSEDSTVQAEDGVFATNQEGVFVAGDMRRGQSLVVQALDEGFRLARKVNDYLK